MSAGGYRAVDGKRDLMALGEGAYKVGRDQNKAELCRCPDRFSHTADCIWYAARKMERAVQKAIARLDLDTTS